MNQKNNPPDKIAPGPSFRDGHNENTSSRSESLAALTQRRATKSISIEIPQITMPKGGGALKGIDEKFEVNAANGTATFSIPLPFTPGRNNFSPALGLSYNSGSGNGICGLGWSLDCPSIQRKTDKRIPRYRETDDEEDVFLLSGTEDLVLHLQQDSPPLAGYAIKKYRPRIEGDFARIETIYHKNHGTYWRVTTRENITTIYGRNKDTRIADPKDLSRIFRWLPELTYDDKGNWIQYHYKKDSNFDEDGKFIMDDTIPHSLYEKNRKSGLASYTNTYLKRVTYGNQKPYYVTAGDAYDPPKPVDESCFFELILDYGEHGNDNQPHLETQKWKCREDSFSTCRAGFEIRTYRRCERILVFHHFEDEEQIHGYQSNGTSIKSSFGKNYLVRSIDLTFEPSSINNSKQAELTYLKSITQKGYIRLPDGSYSRSELPPIEFFYEQLNWNTKIRTVSSESIVNAPVGLTNNYQWVDLYGEGISGILTEQGEAWYYKSNLGNVEGDGGVVFSMAKPVIPKPSFRGLTNCVLSIQDLDANGEKQVVVSSPGIKGFFEFAHGTDWKSFQAFEQVANIDLQDSHTRLIDLNGDGKPELVLTNENAFVWYPSNGKRGHLSAERTAKPFDEEQGPAIMFADLTQSVFLADMTGDGLTDIVQIRNGEICYWPNTGYGEFGAKVTMGDAPVFDYEDHFNPKYLHLADITGTGTTDIVYLGKNQFQAYLNLCGNAWSKSEKHFIDPFFTIDDNCQVSVIDLLGAGTSCIVWSSDLPTNTDRPMRYIDLMDSRKPHLLKKCVNNFGKETSLEYKSATYYYLKDKLDDRPWITKLPFPVQVVSKTIVEDKITSVRFTADYRYRHGYFDHAEREFRGFGMVEQLDTEEYATWKKNSATSKLELTEALYQAPTLTKTWFHTGAFLDGQKILSQYEKEYWVEAYKHTFSDSSFSADEPKLSEARIVSAKGLTFDIDQLSAEEHREALRACKGMTLRQEIFALDGKPGNPGSMKRQAKPFTIGTHNCHIQLLQPRGKNHYAVYLVTQSESLTIHYERNEKDPRVAHSLNLKLDELGNVLESASVVYPRRATDAIDNVIKKVNNTLVLGPDERAFNYNRLEEKQACVDSLQRLKLEQQKTLVTYTQNSFTGDIVKRECYRLRLPSEVRTFEVTGLPKLGAGKSLYSVNDFSNILSNPKGAIAYQATPDASNEAPYYRLIENIQNTYYNDELKTDLPLGTHGIHGIPYQGYQLCYTPTLLKHIFTEVNGGVTIDKLPMSAVELENLLSDNDQNADGDKKYSQCRFVHRSDNNWWIRSGVTSFYLHAAESLTDLKKRFFSPQSYTDPFGAKSTVSYYKDYALLMQAMEDAMHSRVEIGSINFRLLTPVGVKDINDNLSEVILDELSLVKAMAVRGKGDEADRLDGLTDYTLPPERIAIENYFTLSDTNGLRTAAKHLLQGASTRFVYDFRRYRTSVGLLEDQLTDDPVTSECAKVKYLPTVVGSISRERHFHDVADSPLQLGFEYSNGMGNVVLSKSQAEPGQALNLKVNADCNFTLSNVNTGSQLRWLGNGRTVLNNKGNPVKQYEPYFSVNPFFEDGKEVVERGVTPILYYDALSRVIKTELPNGTHSKVEFDSWHQKSYDANDSVADSAWYLERKDINALDPINSQLNERGQTPVKEKAAAEKALLHHNTPSILHVDTLGRPVLGLEHNRWLAKDTSGAITNWEGLFSTWATVDVEGNVRSLIDARGNTITAYRYDMVGNRVFQDSVDAGKRWMLNDVTGKPIRRWDSRKHIFSIVYDILQRPVEMYLQKEGSATKALVEKTTYGEGQTNDKVQNLRGQVAEHYEASGKSVNVAFDFKGNSLEAKRQLAAASEAEVVEWSPGSPTNQLEAEIYTSITEYDALNRITRFYNWHKSNMRVAVYEPRYNERRAKVSEDIVIGAQKTSFGYSGGTRATAISNIEYSEKGQRTTTRFGNGTTTRYFYDTQNFRLVQLRTTRTTIDGKLPAKPSNLSDPNVLQNLFYTYDPVGNITEVEDDAYEPVFFKNQIVEPRSRYSYDALYRLTEASGRENQEIDTAPNHEEFNPAEVNFPVTEKTLRNYTELYQYDAVGNIRQMRHVSVTERWTRNYLYYPDSNRLKSTTQGVETVHYDYDEHGNMLNYSNTPINYRFKWDYRDMPYTVSLGGGGNAFYQYAENRERSRKQIKRTGNVSEQRLYFGAFELYQFSEGGVVKEEIESHHLLADSQRVLLVEDVRQTNSNNLTVGILYRYQYSNHLGSVGLEANSDGDIISYEEYHPYGTIAYHAKNSSIKAAAKRYRYTGMERDDETGLNYHSARYYLPWLARWNSCDPIGIASSVNQYAYVTSNPLHLVDSEGLQEKSTNPEIEAWKAAHPKETEVIEGMPYSAEGKRNRYMAELLKSPQGKNSTQTAPTVPGCRPLIPAPNKKPEGPAATPLYEPYDRRRRLIKTPVDDPLQFEWTEVYATPEEAADMQQQVNTKEASDRAAAALAAASGGGRGSASRAALAKVTPGPAVQVGTTGRTPMLPKSLSAPATTSPAATAPPPAAPPPVSSQPTSNPPAASPPAKGAPPMYANWAPPTSEQIKVAQENVDRIHKTLPARSQKDTVYTLSFTPDGRVILAATSTSIAPEARALAQQLYPNVEIVPGGIKYDAVGPEGWHAEPRSGQGLPAGTWQASSHYSCEQCEAFQRSQGIINVTGNRSVTGKVTRH